MEVMYECNITPEVSNEIVNFHLTLFGLYTRIIHKGTFDLCFSSEGLPIDMEANQYDLTFTLVCSLAQLYSFSLLPFLSGGFLAYNLLAV